MTARRAFVRRTHRAPCPWRTAGHGPGGPPRRTDARPPAPITIRALTVSAMAIWIEPSTSDWTATDPRDGSTTAATARRRGSRSSGSAGWSGNPCRSAGVRVVGEGAHGEHRRGTGTEHVQASQRRYAAPTILAPCRRAARWRRRRRCPRPRLPGRRGSRGRSDQQISPPFGPGSRLRDQVEHVRAGRQHQAEPDHDDPGRGSRTHDVHATTLGSPRHRAMAKATCRGISATFGQGRAGSIRPAPRRARSAAAGAGRGVAQHHLVAVLEERSRPSGERLLAAPAQLEERAALVAARGR